MKKRSSQSDDCVSSINDAKNKPTQLFKTTQTPLRLEIKDAGILIAQFLWRFEWNKMVVLNKQWRDWIEEVRV